MGSYSRVQGYLVCSLHFDGGAWHGQLEGRHHKDLQLVLCELGCKWGLQLILAQVCQLFQLYWSEVDGWDLKEAELF